LSRKREGKRRTGARRPVRATASGGREALAQKVALVLVVMTVILVFIYVILELRFLRWVAGGTALAAVAASIWHFVERGRRSIVMEDAFRRATEPLGRGDQPHPVRVDREGRTAPAVIGSEGDQWYLELDGERIDYAPQEAGAMEAWPDYRLMDFAAQLARRNRLGLRCCGNCAYFGHSTVSRQASQGWVGYCTLSGEGLLLPERDAVHIWHLCKKWEKKRL